MGNFFSNDTYSLAEIDELKNTIGSTISPVFNSERRPAKLNGLFTENSHLNTYLDSVAVPEDDKELLNRFLVILHNHLKVNYKQQNKFLKDCEKAEFCVGNVELVEEITQEHLENINQILSENIELDKIKSVSLAESIYRFPDSTLSMYYRYKSINHDSAFVGVEDGNLTLFSPDTEPTETNCVLFKWLIYELSDEEIYVVPISMEGVMFTDGKTTSEPTNYLSLLEEASQFLNDKNDRTMKLKLDQFIKWKNIVDKDKTVYALTGGEKVGTMDTLNEFFEKLNISELV